MVAPKGFTQHIHEDEYIAARLSASKRTGVRRYTVPMMILAAALALLGGITVINGGFRPTAIFAGIGLVFCAVALEYLWGFVFPKQVKDAARRDFAAYDRLLGGAAVTMTADDVTLSTDTLTRKVEFAKQRVCIETPTQYVLVGNDEFITILQKECFTEKIHTNDFLRDVCARWYVREWGVKE
ncbi:MAG: hypothetical protein IJC52_03700 [Clostridia bacterium]|nr:hypothetical protein [Clostridia bacterium]